MNFDAPIPFEHFMAWALHDPKNGYYARRISGVGGRGDFTTAPNGLQFRDDVMGTGPSPVKGGKIRCGCVMLVVNV